MTSDEKAVVSNNNAITFLIEDEIEPEQVKISTYITRPSFIGAVPFLRPVGRAE